MIYVGIDVSKDKHDCFITNSDGEVLFNSFTIPNTKQGFDTLFQNILSSSDDISKIKVGLEATEHLDNCYAHMEKRGSRYLRYALYNATKYVCLWDENFHAYLEKKQTEGKHYNVAISHAAKKLVRLIYQLEKTGCP